MFIDRAKITVKSGKGGDGCIAFHHEKFIERGGPSGGNGGRGGSIYFKATDAQSTLINYRHARKVMAQEGGKGLAKKMYGRGAEDIILEVPVGTVILDANTNELLCDLSKKDQMYLLKVVEVEEETHVFLHQEIEHHVLQKMVFQVKKKY